VKLNFTAKREDYSVMWNKVECRIEVECHSIRVIVSLQLECIMEKSETVKLIVRLSLERLDRSGMRSRP
jgi:hypothetical protein